MVEHRIDMLGGVKLRTLCMSIAVMHLVSCIVDMSLHFMTVGYVTGGFQCDAGSDDLEAVSKLQFLEPILLVMTIGTHGFYPFPQIISPQYNTYVEHISIPPIGRCYPGMLHVYITDVLNLVVNMIWFKFLVNYITAIKKDDHKTMSMFSRLFIVKLVMQVLYIGYYPHKFGGAMDFQTFCLLKFSDIVISFYLLMIVRRYAAILKIESKMTEINQVTEVIEKPPPYAECMVDEPIEEKSESDAIIDMPEGKKETEVPKANVA